MFTDIYQNFFHIKILRQHGYFGIDFSGVETTSFKEILLYVISISLKYAVYLV